MEFTQYTLINHDCLLSLSLLPRTNNLSCIDDISPSIHEHTDVAKEIYKFLLKIEPSLIYSKAIVSCIFNYYYSPVDIKGKSIRDQLIPKCLY